MPQPLHSQSKELVASLIKYFEREKVNGGPLLNLSNVCERVADGLNLSLRTVHSISKAVKENTPLQKRLRTKPVCDISEAEQEALRNAIYDM